jgi:hypothetical protein
MEEVPGFHSRGGSGRAERFFVRSQIPAMTFIQLNRMNRRTSLSVLSFLVLLVALVAGCGKKADKSSPDTAGSSVQPPADPTAKSRPTTAPAKLSGSEEVMAAIDRKDYDGALAALLRLKQSAVTAEQQVQYANIVDDAKIKLIQAAPTQPKAAEALTVLRRVTGGR